MLEKFFKLILKRPTRVLQIVIITTGALAIVIAFFASVTSDIDKFFNPSFAGPKNYIEENFQERPTVHVTLEAAGENVLSVENIRLQAAMFKEIEDQWPVAVDSLATVLDDHIVAATNDSERFGADKLNLQSTVDHLIFDLWDTDPYEFERIARKSLSNEDAIDALAELGYYRSLTGGLAGAGSYEAPKVKAVRATITLSEEADSSAARDIFKEIRDFTADYTDKITVRHYSSELIGVDIDRRVLINSPFSNFRFDFAARLYFISHI